MKTSSPNWLKRDSRRYPGPANAPDPLRPPPRGQFLGRDSAVRITVGSEDDGSYVTFHSPKKLSERTLYSIRNASQSALHVFLRRPGTYMVVELDEVLSGRRRL